MASSLPSPPYSPTHPPITSPITGLAFWNTNLPPHLHTQDCPSYLQYAFTDHRDRASLATLDRDYTRATWPAVQSLVHANDLGAFRRVPSDLHRYREFTEQLVQTHGSITNFVLRHRLHWTDPSPSDAPPFTNPADYKVLHNDWPYGIDTRIAHLVIWTKFPLATQPVSAAHPRGDLTDDMRRRIQDFVDATFGERCGREKVIWFKNWGALQSVHAVEHLHVMIFEPEPGFIQEITGGDVSMAEKMRRLREGCKVEGELGGDLGKAS